MYLVITSGMFPVVDSVAVLAHTVVAVASFFLHAVKVALTQMYYLLGIQIPYIHYTLYNKPYEDA